MAARYDERDQAIGLIIAGGREISKGRIRQVQRLLQRARRGEDIDPDEIIDCCTEK